MSETTRFGVDPQNADWYYCAVIDRHGETDYIDGYAAGDKPTRTALQEHSRCRHSWVAGMMRVHDEDVEDVAAVRRVVCEKSDWVYAHRDRKPLTILEWTVNPTPHGAHARGN